MTQIRVKSNDLDVTFDLPVTISSVEEPAPPVPAPPNTGKATNLAVHLHGIWTNLGYWDGLKPTSVLRAHINGIKRMGVKYVRVDFGWSSSQPDRGLFNIANSDNSRLSILLDLLSIEGIHAYLVLSRSPAWSGSAARAHFPKPEFVEDFGKWCGWIADTYGTRLVGLEIWNEPNLAEFSGIPSATGGTKSEQMIKDAQVRAAAYIPLLRAADAGIRNAGLGNALPVILGGPSKCDYLFLNECFELGASALCDVIGVHPYQGDQSVSPLSEVENYGTYTGYERERIALGMPLIVQLAKSVGLPIWCTEQGWSAHVNASGIASYQRGVGGANQTEAYTLASTRITETTRFLDKIPEVRMSTLYCAYKNQVGTTAADIHQNMFRLLDQAGNHTKQASGVVGLSQAAEQMGLKLLH